jgi:DNA anti-recombination protein RmuC
MRSRSVERRREMGKRLVGVGVPFLFLVCMVLSFVYAAGENADEMKAKLQNLRQQQAQIESTYKQEMEKINKERDEKVAALKADFHKARNECIRDAKSRCETARQSCEAQLRPLQEEEKKIVEALGPGSGMNFAKRKYDVK